MARLALALIVGGLLQGPQFHSGVRLVVLHASVKDARGAIVTSLEQQAFTVYENGKPQPIRIFHHNDVPVSVGLVIDNSGSMRQARQAVEAAALAFAEASHPADELFVVDFADRPHLDVPMTADRSQLAKQIGQVTAIGGTAWRDAIDLAETYVRAQGTRERRVLLLITDGVDNGSDTTLAHISDAAVQQDLVIYVIGLSGRAGTAGVGAARTDLDRLAKSTGGLAYYPTSLDVVADTAIEIARQIRLQYTIGYAPLNQALDGTYRRIEVTAKGPGRYSVQTRPGYRAIQ